MKIRRHLRSARVTAISEEQRRAEMREAEEREVEQGVAKAAQPPAESTAPPRTVGG